MCLEAGHPSAPDEGVVRGAGRQLEPVTGNEVVGVATRRKAEADRPGGHHDHLVVAVVVRAVPVVRPVPPGGRGEALVPEPLAEARFVGRRHRLMLAEVPRTLGRMPRSTLRYLSASDVVAAMPPLPERLELAERTMTALVRDAELPPKIAVHPRPDGSFVHAMPAHLRGAAPDGADDLVGMKWVAGFGTNNALGIPAINAVVVLNDARTGQPVAVLDGGPITAQRTAAVSGVAIRRFAPRVEGRAPRAALIGAGVQGHSHLAVLGHVLPGVELALFDRHTDRTEALAEAARATDGIGSATTVASAREAVAGADVVVTAASFGPVRQVMTLDWLTASALVVPVDYATYCSAAVAAGAALFLVDQREQFLANRDAGLFDGYPDPDATLGEAILEGTPRPSGRVVVTHLGVGLADVVIGDAIVRRATAAGLGVELPR
jgi:ornithine cyclodeaminase/alanine dehydrogenase-like protein (mu-crystallin family)